MELNPELTTLVNQTVTALGKVIQREIGQNGFDRIERLRQSMASLRGLDVDKSTSLLREKLLELRKLSPKGRMNIARSFTLMLEVMNACENAYRSFRLSQKTSIGQRQPKNSQAVIFVLTAHPTEARSPQNIEVFHQLQMILIETLKNPQRNRSSEISHILEIAWHSSIVRNRSPKVKDEAEHIYSLLLRDDVIFELIDPIANTVPFYVRTWVGGDKDGHPGVDEKVLLQSLSISRLKLIHLVKKCLQKIAHDMSLFPSKDLQRKLIRVEKSLLVLRKISSNDGKRIRKFRWELRSFREAYENELGQCHSDLLRVSSLLHTFPALVVPLELRESSDVIMSSLDGGKKLAIQKMLQEIEKVSRGGEPRWYARGFIISMAESLEHIQTAAAMVQTIFGDIRLPVIPLFEESKSLEKSEEIITEVIKDRKLNRAIKTHWDGILEIMVGYSDSSKEAGVFPSRWKISQALPAVEKVCLDNGLQPVFFHGSGGSIDRGGGSIEDQTAWWPQSALERYKVTVQGEMVDRSLASPAIARRQIESIIESTSRGLQEHRSQHFDPTLEEFANSISKDYTKKIHDPLFLEMAQTATPYSYLSALKIGSRPSKRSGQLTVQGLRAIPWVLCWTQSRVLFPSWWGVGSAWENLSDVSKTRLREAMKSQPVFRSYIKALGFTLAKIELPVWNIYLENSGLPETEIQKLSAEFQSEFSKTLQCYRSICSTKDLLWFRPWLGESIHLRSPMIHPLNLLQLLAKEDKDLQLLRITVTGISSGMLTTG